MKSKVDVFDLITAYQNEKSTETLLPYVDNIIEPMLTKIEEQTEFVSTLNLDTAIKTIFELDIERIKFFIKSYIKTRLNKINKNLYIDESMLSEAEKTYYAKYINITKEAGIYVEEKEEDKKIEFIGFYCLNDISGLRLDNNIVEAFRGDFFVAKLDDVKQFLDTKDIIIF